MTKFMRRITGIWALSLLVSCGHTPPQTNGAPKLFPNAILAEPIKMRVGYTYTTQPFEIAGLDQVWEISVGFSWAEDKLSAGRLLCLIRSRKDGGRPSIKPRCNDDEPGINLRLELINAVGKTVYAREYDALNQNATGQFSRISARTGVGALIYQNFGQYRLKLTVLRDFPELDVATPYLVIDRPFFRSR
jgi:hypothetical protein